ncbi:MAG: LytR/AlgR family response regulator transcription factor [Thermonemataceae bacterium]|mgnify:CR=1 FL=1
MKQLISCIAIDDEPLALSLLTSYIERTPFLVLKGEFHSAKNAVEMLIKEQIDLIFLDIQMPDMTGVDFTKTYHLGAKVVFTTAYEKYAVEGFKLEVSDYLLKPISYEEFLKAAQKVSTYLQWQNDTETDQGMQESFLFVRTEHKIVKVAFDEILFVESYKDYVKIYLTDTKLPILSLLSLRALEEKLPKSHFMRVHRSYIVALSQIHLIRKNYIVFGDHHIPISRQYKDKFDLFLKDKLV